MSFLNLLPKFSEYFYIIIFYVTVLYCNFLLDKSKLESLNASSAADIVNCVKRLSVP
jgi:hypothetical protein